MPNVLNLRDLVFRPDLRTKTVQHSSRVGKPRVTSLILNGKTGNRHCLPRSTGASGHLHRCIFFETESSDSDNAEDKFH